MGDERWLPVPDWPTYEVSDQGRMRSVPRRVRNGCSTRFVRERILAAPINQDGYPCVVLSYRNKQRKYSVHRLVLVAFRGPPNSPSMHGAHGDGNRQNNLLENLRWATPLENSADRKRHGNTAVGNRHGLARATEAQLVAIRACRLPFDEICALTGFPPDYVRRMRGIRGLRRIESIDGRVVLDREKAAA